MALKMPLPLLATLSDTGVEVNIFGRFLPNISGTALFPLYFTFFGQDFRHFEPLPMAKN
jgi:hypothetical protein